LDPCRSCTDGDVARELGKSDLERVVKNGEPSPAAMVAPNITTAMMIDRHEAAEEPKPGAEGERPAEARALATEHKFNSP
jgi:hypothetical protein